MKYSLILLSALLVVACGGPTKEQQASAYLAAAEKYNPAADEFYADYEAAFDSAATDDDRLFAVTELYSNYAGIDRIFADDLAEIQWSSDYAGTAEQLMDCVNEVYLLEIEVLMATDLQAAYDLAEVADQKDESCDVIANELRAALGLDPVPQ